MLAPQAEDEPPMPLCPRDRGSFKKEGLKSFSRGGFATAVKLLLGLPQALSEHPGFSFLPMCPLGGGSKVMAQAVGSLRDAH